ncbi:unnamed protein product [Closterium sp. NIES-54]
MVAAWCLTIFETSQVPFPPFSLLPSRTPPLPHSPLSTCPSTSQACVFVVAASDSCGMAAWSLPPFETY